MESLRNVKNGDEVKAEAGLPAVEPTNEKNLRIHITFFDKVLCYFTPRLGKFIYF